MTSYLTYTLVEYILPFFLAFFTTIGVAVAGSCILNPGKLVRIMFPYITKSGDNTVAFGFILSKHDICILFWVIMLPVVFITMLLFGSVFTEHSYGRHNPFDDAECFYHINNTEINLSLEEAAVLDEYVECFKWNTDLGDALGQATGTLAIAWIFVSVEIWVVLNVGHRVKKRIKKAPKKPRKCSLYYSCFLMIFIPVATFIAYIGLAIVALSGLSWVYYLILPQNFLILFILVSSMVVFCIPITKEPKSLEDYCRETMKEKQEPQEVREERIRIQTNNTIQEFTDGGERGSQIRIDILKEMLELEHKKVLASEAAVYIGKEETKTMAMAAFDKIMQGKNDKESLPTTEF